MSTHARVQVCAPSRAAVAAALVLLGPTIAAAQDNLTTTARAVSLAAAVDIMDDYVFRGVRQNSSEMVVWPSADIGLMTYAGEGVLRGVALHFGFANSLHTGDTGLDGPSGRAWYESQLSAGVRLRTGGALSLAANFVVYTSPNDTFTTVREVTARAALDERAALGAALRPYVLIAFEVDAAPGEGQLDGGLHAGRYLEVGVEPTYAPGRVRVGFPVRVGLSAGNYYELAGTDHRFGFASAGASVHVPLGAARLGTWSVRGGVDYQRLGDTPTAFNAGDRSKTVVTAGLRWAR